METNKVITGKHSTRRPGPNGNTLVPKSDKDEDTMYWDQAMKQPDAEQFLQAAFDEIKTHDDNKHWEVIPINELPEGTPVLDPVWSMKRKRRLKTNEVYKKMDPFT
jgi:hypothetical protein